MDSDYTSPSERRRIIMSSLHDIAKSLLKTLFNEVRASVPNATLTKCSNAIVIQSADGNKILVVKIPITGDNSLSLCSSIMGDVSKLQMSWSIGTKASNGLILCTTMPTLHPISAAMIVAWAQPK